MRRVARAARGVDDDQTAVLGTVDEVGDRGRRDVGRDQGAAARRPPVGAAARDHGHQHERARSRRRDPRDKPPARDASAIAHLIHNAVASVRAGWLTSAIAAGSSRTTTSPDPATSAAPGNGALPCERDERLSSQPAQDGEQRPGAAPQHLQQADEKRRQRQQSKADEHARAARRRVEPWGEEHQSRGKDRGEPHEPCRRAQERAQRRRRRCAGADVRCRHAEKGVRDHVLDLPQVVAAPEAGHRRGKQRQRGHGALRPRHARVADEHDADAGAQRCADERPVPSAGRDPGRRRRSAEREGDRQRRRRGDAGERGQRWDVRHHRKGSADHDRGVGPGPAAPHQQRAARPREGEQAGHQTAEARAAPRAARPARSRPPAARGAGVRVRGGPSGGPGSGCAAPTGARA